MAFPLQPKLLAELVNRLLVFGILIVLTFALPRMMPGDPLALLITNDAARELGPREIDNLRREMGLDGSLWQQLGHYLHSLLQGDLGFSVRHAAPVTTLIGGALPWTLLLIGCALPIYTLAGLMLGIEAGRKEGSLADRVVTSLMVLLISIPPFATAVFLLVLFSITWPILPGSGAEPFFPAASGWVRALDMGTHAILPVTVLALQELSKFFFVSRGEAIVISRRAFIINARARGIGGCRERLNYFGRNLMPATVARMGDSVTSMFGAVFFIEVIFSYPGIGKLTYNAMLERDYVLVQGAIIGLSALVLSVNWVLDSIATLLSARG